MEESKKRGAFEKVKTVKRVRDATDYTAEAGPEKLKLMRSEKLHKFLRDTNRWERLVVSKRNAEPLVISMDNTLGSF